MAEEEVLDAGAEVVPVAAPEEAAGAEPGLEIGDKILILGGSLNKTRGYFYGFGEDRLVVLVSGSSDRVLKIPLVDGLPDPELAIQAIKVLRKAPVPGFIALLDLKVGDFVETFAAEGEPSGTFEVVTVDPELDSATFKDEAGVETLVPFGFAQVPRDLGFEVVRVREPPAELPPQAEGDEVPPLSPVAVDEEDLAGGEEAPGAGEGESEAEGIAPQFTVLEEIEIPLIEEAREVSSEMKVFPDSFQVSEMRGQLFRMLPQAQQKNSLKLQEIRRLVELMLVMRNEVVRYGITGEPRGLQQTSLTTLKELVERPGVPLAKKVIEAVKVLYPQHMVKHLLGEKEDPPSGELSDQVTFEYLSEVLGRIKPLEDAANVETGEAIGGALPAFYQYLMRFYASIQRPNELSVGGKAVLEDEEAFVKEAPDFENKPIEVFRSAFPSVNTKNVPFRMVRLMKERWGRFLTGDERIRIIEPADTPEVTSILIFPRSIARSLGPIRNGSLAQDISLSMMPPRMMRDILLKLGEATEYPTADGILHIGVKGNLLGNVLLKDWLAGQDLVLTGPADVIAKLRGYGVDTIEWNQEQSQVIKDKIEGHIAGLRIWLRKQREENKAALGNLKFEPQPLLPKEVTERLLTRVKGEPLLQKYYEEVQKAMGDLAQIDLNWFSYLLLKAPDLLLAGLGQQAGVVARERQRKVREQFLTRLTASYKAEKRRKDAAEPVIQKPCPHNQSLEDIDKVAKAREDEPRETTKQRLLLEFMTKYRSKIQDGWVWCNVCDQHLMCEHRHLQLQEFLKPREQDVIHKELLLKFSGGVFGGKFICKVCGQGISELEFDTSLEFDDEGRPMIGRSVLEEDRGQLVDEIEGLLAAADKEEDDDDELGTALTKSMARVFKRLAGLVGINPAREDYLAMIEKMTLYHSTLPTREQYAKAKKPQDFDVYYSVRFVAAAAAILLLNIQCKMPEYVIYYTSADCKGVFSGFPIDADGDKQALLCMASAIASVNDNDFPWNLTTLQTRADLVKRRDAIVPFIENFCKDFLKQPGYQAAIQKKREYRVKLYGTESVGGKADQIPSSFRPIPYVVSKEEAASEGVVAAAAGPSSQATAWIRTAHKIAHESASERLNPDAIRTTVTCCLHSVASPQEFWQKAELPPLEPRIAGQQSYRSSTLSAPFAPEKISVLEGKVDPREFYKLFARLCFRGENKGLPHKLGFGLTCSECGLSFTTNPRIPLAIMGSTEEDEKQYKQDLAAESTALKASMEAQEGVEINQDTFEDLLLTAHMKSAVAQEELLRIPRTENTLGRLAAIETIQPLPNWPLLLAGIQGALTEAAETGGLTEIQISTAAEEMIALIVEREAAVKARLGEEPFEMLMILLQKPSRELGEVLQSYFLAPFQRWLSRLDVTHWTILDTYELSEQTKSDILTKGIAPHVLPLGNGRPLEGLAKRKTKAFVNDLSAVCREIFPALRPLLTPGGKILVDYLKRAYVIGVLQRFLDPNDVPEGIEELEEGGVPNLRALYGAIAMCLKRVTKTSRIPTEQEIREKLEARAELEKQDRFRKFERLTPDERKAYLMNQRLGTGEFAVGGTKAIREYDPEYYDRERMERMNAGILDYDAGYAQDMAAAADGGYDVDQGWD